jgi:hypothetical protein
VIKLILIALHVIDFGDKQKCMDTLIINLFTIGSKKPYKHFSSATAQTENF